VVKEDAVIVGGWGRGGLEPKMATTNKAIVSISIFPLWLFK